MKESLQTRTFVGPSFSASQLPRCSWFLGVESEVQLTVWLRLVAAAATAWVAATLSFVLGALN